MTLFRVLASCHDLGGANQLIHCTLESDVSYVLTGPALSVAETLRVSNILHTEDLDLSKFDKLLVASNQDFQLSDKLLTQAKILGIPTVGYLDHWVNYKTRWTTVPDKIIVTDWFAFINAFFAFGFRVRRHRNHYLKSLKTKFYLEKNHLEPSRALFLVQPFENGYKHDNGSKTCVCKIIEVFLNKKDVAHVCIRDHATTNSNECIISLKNRFSKIAFSKSDWTRPLEVDIFESHFVLGHDTYAMYVARKLGKNVLALGKRRAWVSPIYKRI